MASSLSTAAVRAALVAERGGSAGSWPWTSGFLEQADRQFGGAWREVGLTGPEAAAIVLPAHAGEPCHGDRLTLSGPGQTVAAAADAIGRLGDAYAAANATCWSRIARASRDPFSTLILTPAPLDLAEYRGVEARPGRLYHLDGLHRLIGWAMAGRLTSDARITAFLVGSDLESWRLGSDLEFKV